VFSLVDYEAACVFFVALICFDVHDYMYFLI